MMTLPERIASNTSGYVVPVICNIDFCFTDDKLLSIGPQMRGIGLKMKPEIQWIEERMAS